MYMVYESCSEEETMQLGLQLGQTAEPGGIYCLQGDLGVGKTVFTKGFAKGLLISEDITSPTFTIINEYEGRLPLYHFDVYRIGCIDEMDDTGYEEYFYSQGVCLIEWAELIQDLIPDNAYWITIDKDYEKSDDYRRIEIKRCGQ